MVPRPEPHEERPLIPIGADPEEEPGAVADAALAGIRMQPGIRARELAALLGLALEDLERPLAALLAAGHVRKEDEGEAARFFDV